jgi:hypothetical protein
MQKRPALIQVNDCVLVLSEQHCLQVAGWVGIWVALVAFYAATAILTGEVYDHVRSLWQIPLIICSSALASHLCPVATAG